MWFHAPRVANVYDAITWLIRLSAFAIVPLRRSAAAARSWLLLILFLPIPGLLLYLAIGNSRFPARRLARFRAVIPFIHEVGERLAALPQAAAPDPIAALARRLDQFPAVTGNSITLITDYDAVIDSLVADIDGAQSTVRLLVYLYADDATGSRVAAALGRAVARGVLCQVMIDPVGSHRWLRRSVRLLRAAGVDIREALPLRLLRGRTRRDMRNHRKLFVIDGAIGYAGSQNIVDQEFRPGVINRELVARVTGPVVAEMEAVVRGDWFLDTGTWAPQALAIPESTGDARAQLLPSGAEYPLEGFETLLVWQLHQARARVTIVTPYFIPDEDIVTAMRTAVARGVEVNLVISQVVDQWLVNLAQCSYYDDLLADGIRVHRFRTYLLHAKNVSIDGRFAVIGSSNVDLRSFTLNEEVSLLLLDTRSAAELEAVQLGFIAASDLLDGAAWRRRSRLRKAAENLARLVSPLL